MHRGPTGTIQTIWIWAMLRVKEVRVYDQTPKNQPARATHLSSVVLRRGGGGQPPLSKSAPLRLYDPLRTRMTRTLPPAVCARCAVAVETYAASAKADLHASISSRLHPFLHYKRGRHAVELPYMGYQRGPHKPNGHGPCCASRKYVFTAKYRRASPVRATKSAASLLCCCEKGEEEGSPRCQKAHPPPCPTHHARV